MELELEIPPEAEYVGAARLFLAAVGRHFALDEEAVADMKMAVSEVCAGAAEDLASPGVLRITVRPAEDRIEVEVAPVDRRPRHVGSASAALSWETALREPLVRALFPEASYDAAAHILRLSVPREKVPAE
ncbi:MAG TPA: ATP-binding protein [Actinomycetota bacterium]|nr:ATP-binding protein [Actinomycetota bacterium]